MFDDTPHRWGRPTAVWTVVLLDLTGALLCLYGAVAPPTPHSPVLANTLAATLALVLAAALWRWGPGDSAWLVHLNLTVFILGTTGLVAVAATGEGALSASFAYAMVLMHAAMFFPLPTRRLYLAIVLTTFTAALLTNDVIVALVAAWLPVTLTCLVGSELLGWLRGQMRRLAATDPLTGLPNRAGFEHAAAREIAVAHRTGTPLTLAVIDLDDFKGVNDAHGHAAGDALLRDLARYLAGRLRARDLIARLGGDEFVLLLPDTDLAGAATVMAKLQAGAPTPWTHGTAPIPLDPLDGELDRALATADAAMYAHKRDYAPTVGEPPRRSAESHSTI